MSQTNPLNVANPINSQYHTADPTQAAQSSSTVNPAEKVNLAAGGLTLNTQGQLVPSNTLDADNSPALPNVGGGDPSTQGAAQGAVANWLTMKPGSLSQALGMLSDIAASNMQTMQQIRTEAGLNEYMTQEQSADAQVAQVQGERQSAWTKFTGAMIGGGISVLAAAGGGALGANSPTGAAAGFAAALSGLATPITQMTNSTTDLIDKTSGGQYQADQAKIAKSYLDMLATIFKSQDDSFNSEVQNAQKSLQNVWDLKRSVADQNSQTVINTASNV